MALALGGTASAAPPNDSAIGSGKVAVLGGTAASFSLSAHSGPQGEDAKGNLNFRDISFNVPGSAEKATATVTCLAVSGNRAAIVGEFKKDTPFPGFPFAVIVVEDNGEPGGAVPDRGLALGFRISPPCQDVLSFFTQPLEQGNVVVRDAA